MLARLFLWASISAHINVSLVKIILNGQVASKNISPCWSLYIQNIKVLITLPSANLDILQRHIAWNDFFQRAYDLANASVGSSAANIKKPSYV